MATGADITMLINVIIVLSVIQTIESFHFYGEDEGKENSMILINIHFHQTVCCTIGD